MAQSDKEMLRLTDQNLKNMREIRHDLKNQIGVMDMLLSSKEYEKLKEYFEKFKTSLKTSFSTYDCGNDNISKIINMEMSKANPLNIKIVPKIAVPKYLPFEDYDLCSLLSNMIDNAIESIDREKIKDASIDVEISIINNGLYVYVSNPILKEFSAHELANLNSEKRDNLNHGLGHIIINKICEKYGGYASFSVENNRFIVMALLDLAKGVTDGK